jgi:hypothetical protein
LFSVKFISKSVVALNVSNDILYGLSISKYPLNLKALALYLNNLVLTLSLFTITILPADVFKLLMLSNNSALISTWALILSFSSLSNLFNFLFSDSISLTV